MKRHWGYLVLVGSSLVIFAIFLQSHTTLAAIGQVALTPTPTANAVNQTHWNPPGELTFDVKNGRFFNEFNWLHNKLADGSIILTDSKRVMEEYTKTGKITLKTGNEHLYFIVTVDSSESEVALVKQAIEKFFGDSEKIGFEEPEISAAYRGGMLTRVDAFIFKSSAIRLTGFYDGDIREDFSVAGSALRLQNATYGIVIGIEPWRTTDNLALTLSSTDTPIPPQDLLFQQANELEVLPIFKDTALPPLSQEQQLSESYHTTNILELNYTFSYPKKWVVLQDAAVYGETTYVGTSHAAIQAHLRNEPIPSGEMVGAIDLLLDHPSVTAENMMALEQWLDLRLRLNRMIRQNSAVDAIYVDQTAEQQLTAYAAFLQPTTDSHIVAVQKMQSHAYVELFATKGESNDQSLAIAAAIAQSIQPDQYTYKDKFILEATGSFRDTFFAGFEEYIFHFPGNWEMGANIPHFGAMIESPIVKQNGKERDVIEVMFTGVPLFSPAQFIQNFDTFGLGIQTVNLPQGFLLGNRQVLVATGSDIGGGDLLLIVLRIGLDSSGKSQYVAIRASTPEGVAMSEFEETVFAIAETIHRASESEPASNSAVEATSTPPTIAQNVPDINANLVSVNQYVHADNLCVEPGDTVRLIAKGAVQVGFWVGAVDPDGTRGSLLGDGSLVWLYPHGSLLCKLSSEKKWRFCGSFLEFTAPSAGCLEFEVNDENKGNNQGAFTVDVSIMATNSNTPAETAVMTATNATPSTPTPTATVTTTVMLDTHQSLEEILQQAEAFYWQANDEEAFALYEKALALAPDSVVALTGRGNIYRFRKEYELALHDFERVLALDPTYAPVHRGLGRLYQEQDNAHKALAAFTKAIELDPTYVQGYLTRGDHYYYEEDDYELALADFNKVVELDPTNPEGFSRRGSAHYSLGNYNTALADQNTALQLDPNYAIAYAMRGLVYFVKENYTAAFADFSQAIDLDPTYAYAYDRRGSVYATQGNWSKALADYSKAIELGGEYANLLFRRGIAHAELNYRREALADYTKAIELAPDYTEIYYYRALLYDKTNDAQSAYNDYLHYLELNPEDTYETRYACYQADALHSKVAETLLDSVLGIPCTRFLNSFNRPTCYSQSQYEDLAGNRFSDSSCYDSRGVRVFDMTCNESSLFRSCTCPDEWAEWGAC
jgi:tetratricopeptide (TPR) repeat protein